jgi:CspA family cold shock protein
MTARFKDYRQRRKRFDGDEFEGPRGFGGGGGGAPPPSTFGGPRPAWRPRGPAAPRMPLESSGPPIIGTVKWFNGEKGFGFLETTDGGGDVFMHVAVLESAGHKSASPGATIECRVAQGAKGRQVTEVISVDESTATPEAPRAPRGPRPMMGGGMGGGPRMGGGGRGAPDLSGAVDMSGKVKWYNMEKGFGFIEVGDGGRDVFVHATALVRSGLTVLDQGQSVRIKVVQGMKGREAATVEME